MPARQLSIASNLLILSWCCITPTTTTTMTTTTMRALVLDRHTSFARRPRSQHINLPACLPACLPAVSYLPHLYPSISVFICCVLATVDSHKAVQERACYRCGCTELPPFVRGRRRRSRLGEARRLAAQPTCARASSTSSPSNVAIHTCRRHRSCRQPPMSRCYSPSLAWCSSRTRSSAHLHLDHQHHRHLLHHQYLHHHHQQTRL